ncbi:MAG: DUF1028 domain-containing protein [Candidatus Rokubacteria bacterium]|nr:DUF1028 domain-containing protein [Candidatus Rokubacteria bacterium]
MVARSSDSRELGVAVSTAVPAVGALVPHVSLKGAIATQATVNIHLGLDGLQLLDRGVPLGVALEGLLRADPRSELRQVHGIDAAGIQFVHTGAECVPWAGHLTGPNHSVAGNMLVGEETIRAMSRAFVATEASGADLAERLLTALDAGQAAGGDKRGKQSAALLVASPEPRFYHNLRVDDHPDPVAELRRLFELVRKADPERLARYAKSQAVFRVKW